MAKIMKFSFSFNKINTNGTVFKFPFAYLHKNYNQVHVNYF